MEIPRHLRGRALQVGGLPPDAAKDGVMFKSVLMSPNTARIIGEPKPGVTGSETGTLLVDRSKGVAAQRA
jgi:hypothetical protein